MSEPEKQGIEEDQDDNVTFASLGVCEPLCEACEALQWKKPSPIQRETIPSALEGKDIIGLAQTGSGKTAAFVIPILQKLLQTPRGLFACIIAPTRELAVQISEQCEALGAGIGVKCAVVIGGVDPMNQAIVLGKKPHIIIGV
jgi:ATP-dependent RNA helicase DDX47/RRP3